MSATLHIPTQAQASDTWSKASFTKSVITDFWQMTLCFGGAVVAVYYAPSIVNYLYFLVIVGLFWRTKHDYFYFAFYFIVINTPAFLFFETSGSAAHRLPLYKLTGGISFSVLDLFVLASIAKAFVQGKAKTFRTSKSLRFLLIYFVLVSVPISFILGAEESSFFNNFRPFFYYAVLATFYFLVDDVEDLFRFGYLMVPYVLFTLFDQLFLLTQGKLLISYINPETIRAIVNNTVTQEARAYFSGFLVVFYAFWFAIQMRIRSRYELFNGLSYLIIFLSLATFVLSATRVYLMIPMAVVGMYVLYSQHGGSDLVKVSIVGFFLAIIFFSLNIISFDFILNNIWPRFEAFFEVIAGGGDLAKFDTLRNRVEEDWPDIMMGVNQSPIIGVGFGDAYRRYENDDLGFINTVLIFGWVGFGLFINFLISFYRNLGQWLRHPLADEDAQVVLNTMRMLMAGILLGYATTYDLFTVRQIDHIYFVSIIIASSEVAVDHIQLQKTNFSKRKLTNA